MSYHGDLSSDEGLTLARHIEDNYNFYQRLCTCSSKVTWSGGYPSVRSLHFNIGNLSNNWENVETKAATQKVKKRHKTEVKEGVVHIYRCHECGDEVQGPFIESTSYTEWDDFDQ